MTGHEIRVAPDGMPAVRCCDCLGQIRPGHEFYIEHWQNAGGFDYHHIECPKIDPMPSPERRVVQGHDRPTRRQA